MTNLDIVINSKSLLYYSPSLRKTLDEKTISLITKAFVFYIKDSYFKEIKNAINTGKYKGNWEPIDDEGYLEYLGVTPVGDILVLIYDSLEVVKRGYNYIVQINPYYKYPGTKLPLVKVLRAIESGTSDFDSRPLLVKCNRRIKFHLRELWRGYLILKGAL